MRKISPKLKRHYLSKQKRKSAKQIRAAIRRKQLRFLEKIHRLQHTYYYKITDFRKEVTQKIYKNRKYDHAPKVVEINKDFGIEEKEGISYFLEKAESFIDFNSKELYLDITNCNRIWPSGITLLCSLLQWIELTSTVYHRPRVASSSSENIKVNSYLGHCGFYDYVQREKDMDQSYYDNKHIVKIRREKNKSNIEKRENMIIELLKEYSTFSDREIEFFDSVILT